MSLVDRSTIIDKLNPHLVKLIGIAPQVSLKKIPARDILFKSNRFDLLLRYAYVEAYAKRINIPFFRDLYKGTVRCMTAGTYQEGDGQKNSLSDFEKNFHALIDAFRQNGFNDSVSYIPVNEDGECIDGAHRIAAAAYFNLDVTTVELTHKHKFDYRFFLKKGLKDEYLDYIAQLYCALNPNSYIVTLHPIADGHDDEVEQILNATGEIYYRKNVRLSDSGYHFLSMVSYKNEPWVGNIANGFAGALAHSQKCNQGNKILRVYAIHCPSLPEIRKIKEAIRDIYKQGNYSVHITDTREETLDLAQLFFNKNSFYFFNNTRLLHVPYTEDILNQIAKFKLWTHDNKINLNDILIDASFALAAYGLRPSRDIDYIINGSYQVTAFGGTYDNHQNEIKHHNKSANEVIYDPENYFYFNGVKVIALPALLNFKINRMGNPKDFSDIKLIKQALKTGLFSGAGSFRPWLRAIVKKMVWTLFPKGTFQRKLIRKFLNFLSMGKVYLHRLTDPEIANTNYLGYRLFYSRKTSIVERFFQTGGYETEIQETITSCLNQIEGKKTFLDIGANIGMISLGALKNTENLKIHAFEPGPHQYELFKKTIGLNKLEDKIQLYPIALSDSIGTSKFFVHSSEHASGDGIYDTGRAGEGRTIDVRTDTLDHWWQTTDCPKVDLLKIDVEGAELLVLRGGETFLKKTGPKILLEAHTENIKNYPYTIDELFDFLKKLGYAVKNLNMSDLGHNQIERLRGKKPYGCEILAILQNHSQARTTP